MSEDDPDVIRLEGVLTAASGEDQLRLYVDDVLEEFVEFPEAGTVTIEPLPQAEEDFVQSVAVTLAARTPVRRGRMSVQRAEEEAREAIEPGEVDIEEALRGGMLMLRAGGAESMRITRRGCTGPISFLICPSSKCTTGPLCTATEKCTNDAYCPVPSRVRECPPDTRVGPC